MAQKLNEATVKSLPVPLPSKDGRPANKVHYFPDAVLQGAKTPRGFGVRVTSGGVRSFVINYRIAERERRYTIGTYPDWSVLAAVKEARELRQRIDRGEDPMEARRYGYLPQKRDALDRLAALVQQIIRPPTPALEAMPEQQGADRTPFVQPV